MTSFAPIISEYYSRIDALDHNWVVDLFSSQAVYRRAGKEYQGRSCIEHFFRNERKIAGCHRVHELFEDRGASTVVAVGHFKGRGETGDPRAVEFADVWKFDADHRVELRLTYLAMGHAYVEK